MKFTRGASYRKEMACSLSNLKTPMHVVLPFFPISTQNSTNKMNHTEFLRAKEPLRECNVAQRNKSTGLGFNIMLPKPESLSTSQIRSERQLSLRYNFIMTENHGLSDSKFIPYYQYFNVIFTSL